MLRFELGSKTLLMALAAAAGLGGYKVLDLVPNED